LINSLTKCNSPIKTPVVLPQTEEVTIVVVTVEVSVVVIAEVTFVVDTMDTTDTNQDGDHLNNQR